MRQILFGLLFTCLISTNISAQRGGHGGHSSGHGNHTSRSSHKSSSNSKTRSSKTSARSSSNSSNYSVSKPVHVSGYFRRDGTYVHSYNRALPGTAIHGSRRERVYNSTVDSPISVNISNTTDSNIKTFPLYIHKKRYYTKDGTFVSYVPKDNASPKDLIKAEGKEQKRVAGIEDCKRKAEKRGKDISKCETKDNISPSTLMGLSPIDVSVETEPEPNQQ